jgi:hypothetical protein
MGATCVTIVKCREVVDTVSIIKNAIPTLGSASFLAAYKRTIQTGKNQHKMFCRLGAAMKKLMVRETPLVLNVMQVLQLYKKAVGLRVSCKKMGLCG